MGDIKCVEDNITTVGQLREYLKQFPDDLAIGGSDDQQRLDYCHLSFYLSDRSKDTIEEFNPDDPLLNEWWEGPPPIKVLVIDTE